MQLELHFGHLAQIEYQIGDKIKWRKTESVKSGGRPKGGNLDGSGYGECPKCERDFFVLVHIVDDKIAGVKADESKPGYIAD